MNFNIQIKSNTFKPQTGQLLISEPFLPDSYFKRSVILLIEHSNTEGSVGIILNKKLDIYFNKLINNAPHFKTKVFFGGPVETSNLYFIHSLGDIIPNSKSISNGVFWGGDINVVNELISDKILNTNNIRFFLGYSGWIAHQLENELKANSWAVVKNNDKDLFSIDINNMWNIMVEKLGNSYKFWNNLPSDPQQN